MATPLAMKMLSCMKRTVLPVQQCRSLLGMKKKYQPDVFPSLEERLKEIDPLELDPELNAPVDISLPPERRSRRERMSGLYESSRNPELERLSLEVKLNVDLELVEKYYNSTTRPNHIRILADHYGIFSDLFGLAYFTPRLHLEISYDYDEDFISCVHQGNILKPFEASSEPTVSYACDEDSLHTLVLTNPDGNLYSNEDEVLHWFVGNIPGNKVAEGDVIVDYLQPFPPKGTGYHRHVFILYKQEKVMDYSSLKMAAPCTDLKSRTFSTLEFYKERQDFITPAGIAWFMSDWDRTLPAFFHNTLKMKEPIYEYEFPPPYINPPVYYPKKREFNVYIDRYRDSKDIAEEMLLKRLAKLDPLKKEPEVPRFPAAIPVNSNDLSWIKIKQKKEHLGAGKYRQLYRGSNRPRQ